MLTQKVPSRQGEPQKDGQGGDDRRDNPADEQTGQAADREGNQRPGGERDATQVEQAGSEQGRLEKG